MEGRVADVRQYIEGHDRELYREAPLSGVEIRDSGNGIPGSYAIKGLASVYNKWSLDLGGFRERIMPGAFDRVLGEDPHVIHTWDHDTARALSSTTSSQFPLELKSVKDGLQFYSRVAPTTDAANLRILMEGGVVDQSSFAFTVKDAEWRYLEEEDMVERDIVEVDGLYDVTTCALGAYPQTESVVAVRSLLRAAPATAVFFPAFGGTASSSFGGSNVPNANISFGTRSSGAEGNAEQPAESPAPQEDAEEASAAEPAAPDEGEAPPADQAVAPDEKPEDREAKEREFRLWQQKRDADYRRTREFAFGVHVEKEDER